MAVPLKDLVFLEVSSCSLVTEFQSFLLVGLLSCDVDVH